MKALIRDKSIWTSIFSEDFIKKLLSNNIQELNGGMIIETNIRSIELITFNYLLYDAITLLLSIKVSRCLY